MDAGEDLPTERIKSPSDRRGCEEDARGGHYKAQGTRRSNSRKHECVIGIFSANSRSTASA
jgi:hypothetical protein